MLTLTKVILSQSWKTLLKWANFETNFSTLLAASRYEHKTQKNSLTRCSQCNTGYESSKDYGSKVTVVGDEELCLSGDQEELVLWWPGSYFLGNQVFLAQERFLGYF